MRFLIGLMMGAGLILVLVQQFGVAPERIVAEVRGFWQQVAQQADAVTTPAQDAATGAAFEVAERVAAMTPAAPAAVVPEAVVPEAVVPEAVVRGAVAADPPVADGVGDEAWVPGAVATEAVAPEPAPALAPPPVEERVVAVNAQAEAALAAAFAAFTESDRHAAGPVEPRWQPVWTPFHSERSARGFADRLSRLVTHPFEVKREGPRQYQVVFAYVDEAERDAVFSELSEKTGATL